MAKEVALPRVDLSAFYADASGPDDALTKRYASRALGEACEETGMFYVTLGEGVVSSLTTPAFEASGEIFSLPKATKASIAPEHPRVSAARGYITCGAESGSDLPELKECFACAPEPAGPTLNLLQAPNVWPDPPGQTAAGLQRYLRGMKRVASAVCSAMSHALGDGEMEGLSNDGHDVSMLRIFRYFASGSRAPVGVGSSPHTDWGLFTIIAARQTEGEDSSLQIYSDSRWQSVPSPGRDAFVVNCGDYMQLRTAGRWRSPLHRVTRSAWERTSLCFFQYPCYNAPVPVSTSQNQLCTANQKLSLLCNQATNAAHDETETQLNSVTARAESFGAMVAAKWIEVSRS